MNLEEKLVNVRRATRLLATYYRRVVTILGLVQHALEERPKLRLKFVRWQGAHHRIIGKQSVPPMPRWGWDFLPLQDAWLWWSTDAAEKPSKPGHVGVSIYHQTDDGYVPSGSEEPDPGTFKVAEDTATWIHVAVYALVRGSSADTWGRIVRVAEDAFDDEASCDGLQHEVPSGLLDAPSADVLVRYVGWSVDVKDLETDDDVERLILAPLKARLDAILVLPTV